MFANTMNWPNIDSEFYRVGSMMERTCLKLANAISASNQCSANWCAEHYGLDASAIPVIYTGIDTELFYPRAVPKAERPTIVFVGSIRINKGVDLLVEAACIIAKDVPDLHLRILGKGDPALIKRLKQIAIDAGLPDLLDFPGQVKREDLPLQLSTAHFFAGPSIYEGGPGNVYLEAMACGLPAIACSGSGIDGIVTSFENGMLIPPNNVEALIDAMRTLLTDKALCKTLGENARDYVLREADSKKCMKQLESFYKSVSEMSVSKSNANQYA
jgi:glycosyltransferase involved in cell wall biosynthesis